MTVVLSSIFLGDNKPVNMEGLETAMMPSWGCADFSIQRIDEVFHHVFFSDKDTVEYFVLNNGPWSYGNPLVFVRP